MAKKLSSNLFKVSVAPEAGADATAYWLSPSVTQVKRTVTGTHIPEYVTCTSMAKTGDDSPVTGIGTIRFVAVYKSGSSSAEAIYSSNIVVTSDMAAISFRLYLGAVQMDEKTVLVVDDGGKGDQGRAGRMPFPSGAWDISRSFTATDDVAPVVLYEPGNMYYVMNKSVTVTGLNPATDYAENGTNATWLPFESYQAIFTNILMANFAKLASGIFWGDHMFSQHGKDVNGNDVNSYELFDPTKIGQSDAPFTPNALVDWLTGTMRLLKLIAIGAEISGKIEADSGNIGGFEIASGRIGSEVNTEYGGGELAIYNNLIRVGNSDSYSLLGGDTIPATAGGAYTSTCRFVNNTKKDSYNGANYGMIINVSGAKRNYGIKSDAPILATSCIGMKIARPIYWVNYKSDDGKEFDFSKYSVYLIASDRYMGLNLPDESTVASYFGLTSLPSDFSLMFTLHVRPWSYDIRVNNVYDWNANLINIDMVKGDSLTLLISKYDGFRYDVLNKQD